MARAALGRVWEMLRTPWGDADSLESRKSPPATGGWRTVAKREQRERLYAAMVACCERKGYDATSVADLLDVAGVSRGTFYAQFQDKLDCFRATERELLRMAVEALKVRFEGEGDAERRARDAFAAMLDILASQPAASRLAIVESYAAGEVGVEPIRATLNRIVDLGRAVAEQMPERAGMPPELVRAVIGGFYQVIYNRLRTRREAELPEAAPELLEWGMGYRPPPRRLRRSTRRPSLDSAPRTAPFALYNPEQRIIRAFAAVVARKGYPRTTISDIAAEASISQTTFYQHFADKADLLEAALDSSGAQMLAATLPSVRRAPDWQHAVRAGLDASCAFLAAEPDFARLRMVEVYAAGPDAIALRDRTEMSFIGGLLEPAFANRPDVSELLLEALVGAILGVFYERIRNDGPASLLDAVPLLTYMVLAPLIGADEACAIANGESAPRRARV